MALTTQVKRNPNTKQADSDMPNDPAVWQEPLGPEGEKKNEVSCWLWVEKTFYYLY